MDRKDCAEAAGAKGIMETEERKRSYEVRWAKETEWAPAMQMIWRTFLRFDAKDYKEEGIRNFFNLITDDNLYAAFLRGDYRMMVAVEENQVIGAGTLRNRNHLSLLFVEESHHRTGVGRAIMEALDTYLREEADEYYMSLLAAPYAVGFYKKLGFCEVKPEEEISGIRVTAMEKVF